MGSTVRAVILSGVPAVTAIVVSNSSEFPKRITHGPEPFAERVERL
jgi:hypothetical protein